MSTSVESRISTEDTSTPEQTGYENKLIAKNSEIASNISKSWDMVGEHLASLLEHFIESRNGRAVADLYVKISRAKYGNKIMAKKIKEMVYHYFALVIETTPSKSVPVKHHIDKEREKTFKIVGELVSPRTGKQTHMNEYENQSDVIKLLKNSAKEDDAETGFRHVLKILEENSKPKKDDEKRSTTKNKWTVSKKMKENGSFGTAFDMAVLLHETWEACPQKFGDERLRAIFAKFESLNAELKKLNADILHEVAKEQVRQNLQNEIGGDESKAA